MIILGTHMSIAEGFSEAARKTGEELGCNALQFFTKSPRSRAIKPIDGNDALKFREYCEKYQIKYAIAHSSYLLNFGKPMSQIPWALTDIKTDFERLHLLGGQGIVVHIGKSLDGERDAAINNVIENAKQVIEQTKRTNLQYILENTAGQGTEIGFQLEELGKVWQGLKGFSPRLRSCMDTAHIWAAGYDISTEGGVKKTLKEYDELIGLGTLSCFHFNDSKKELGTRVDRHANIGHGFIKGDGLATIAKFASEKSIPMILETPEKDGITHEEDIEVVRKMLV